MKENRGIPLHKGNHMKVSNRVIEAYEVYYRKNGEKRSVILNTHPEVVSFKSKLKRNKRKYLGNRPVRLVEVLSD